MPSNFDKFTERARKALSLAQKEALRLNHPYIGTEHLLLGLLREGKGLAPRVLNDMGVQLDEARFAVEIISGRREDAVVGEIGLTPSAKKVIEFAIDEARRLDCNYIGTEHMLMGLVREGDGVASVALESFGVDLQRIREQVALTLASDSRLAASGETVFLSSDSGRWPESPKLKDLRSDLELASNAGDHKLAVQIEDELALLTIRELDSHKSRMVDELVYLERSRLEMDSKISRVLEDIEDLRTRRIRVFQKIVRAKRDSRSAQELVEAFEGDDLEDRRSAQE